MTMLERVAEAIWEADPINPPLSSLTPHRFSWNLAMDQARAALMAIREPSDAILMIADPGTSDEDVPINQA